MSTAFVREPPLHPVCRTELAVDGSGVVLTVFIEANKAPAYDVSPGNLEPSAPPSDLLEEGGSVCAWRSIGLS